MEINANVTNTVAASISKLNINTSKRSFRTQEYDNKENKKEIIEESKEPINLPEEKKLAIDVEDVQKYAKYMGENLSIDDINYALMYGRSVIADYSI